MVSVLLRYSESFRTIVGQYIETLASVGLEWMESSHCVSCTAITEMLQIHAIKSDTFLTQLCSPERSAAARRDKKGALLSPQNTTYWALSMTLILMSREDHRHHTPSRAETVPSGGSRCGRSPRPCLVLRALCLCQYIIEPAEPCDAGAVSKDLLSAKGSM